VIFGGHQIAEQSKNTLWRGFQELDVSKSASMDGSLVVSGLRG